MFGNRARIGLAALALSGAMLTASAFAGAGEAQAFGGYERSYDRPAYGYGWRPAPPAFHGYWGQRRWQRWNEERRDDAYYGRRYDSRYWR